MSRSAIFVAAIFAAQFSGAAHAGCEKDTDCKGDRICEAGACVNPPTAASPEPAAEAEAEAEAAATEDNAASATTDQTAETTEAPTETPAEPEAKPTDPKDWWKEVSREAEAPILQAIFEQMPRPIRKKGNAKLVYQRAVPVVVSDVHNTTTRWGGKKQVGVHFMGISKIHTTTTLDPITQETPGIAYCPVNCARITEVKTDRDQLTLLYDGPIKDWAGNVGDNAEGYIRQVGKQYKTSCSMPVLFNHAPKNSWLDPEKVQEVKDQAVTEIKRYCGMD
jgi:hypothetical protein